MQLVFFLILAVIAVSLIVAFVLAILSMAAIGLAIGLPIYFILRHWSRNNPRIARLKQSPLERLQQLYIDGRIDLFEYESRLARLIAIEH